MEWDPSLLIHAGALLYILAFLVREELLLRLLVVSGTVLYILYYYLFPDTPLWDAIIASVIMLAANGLVLGQILWERTTLKLSAEEKELYEAFDTLTPGRFRDVLKIANWQTADEDTILTREDQPSRKLFYIFRGVISVEKTGRQFRLPEGNFVGEIAFVLKGDTTSTTLAPAGVTYVEWETDELRKLSKRRPNLGNALNALLTRDIARKLKTSYQPDSALPAKPSDPSPVEVAADLAENSG